MSVVPHNYRRRFHSKASEKIAALTQKLVVFRVESDRYAIPVERVQSVLEHGQAYAELPTGQSLIQVNEIMVTLVQPERLLLGKALTTNHYLIICILDQGELLGIPVATMPSTVDVTSEQFEALPTLYRQGDLSPGVEKLIRASDAEMMFYLNVDRLVETDA